MVAKKRTNLRVVSWLIPTIVIAMLITMMPKTTYAVSRAITGQISCGQNQSLPVYSGPSAITLYDPYTRIGTVANGALVYIVSEEIGWYQILYGVNGQEAIAYIPRSQVIQLTYGPIPLISFTGGQRYSAANQQVWSVDELSTRVHIGNIDYEQGFTLLDQYSYNGYVISYIEYSTSSGPARGYLFNGFMFKPYPVLPNGDHDTKVARVLANASVYYTLSSPGAGSVYKDELVTVITKFGNTVYIEYNASSGRKRGFLSVDYLSIYNKPSGFQFLDNYFNLSQPAHIYPVTSPTNIYAGPSTKYAVTDTLNGSGPPYVTFGPYFDSMYYAITGDWCFVTYSVNGVWKSGWTPGW